MFAMEQLHPSTHRLRQAQLLGAVMNGPVQRASKRPFAAGELMGADPWQAARKVHEPRRLATFQQLKAQVSQLNTLIRP